MIYVRFNKLSKFEPFYFICELFKNDIKTILITFVEFLLLFCNYFMELKS